MPDVIRAKAFQVVDDEGNGLLSLVGLRGAGAVVIFDRTGEMVVTVGAMEVDGKRAGLVGTFLEGRILVQLGFGGGSVTDGVRNYGGKVMTYNDQEKPVVELGVTKRGQGTVTTWNDQGKELVKLGATKGGRGTVTTSNDQGKEIVKLGATVEGDGTITTFDGQGKQLVDIGIMVDGEGGRLQVYNKTGEFVCILAVDEYGNGVIGAFDRNGKGRTLKPGP